MALSQATISFQPSGLFAKVLLCLRWPLAQLASKVSLDTSIPSMASLIVVTIIAGGHGKAPHRATLYAESAACRVPGYRSAWTAELGEARPYLPHRFVDRRDA